MNKIKSETKTFMFSDLVNGVLMIGQNMVTLAVFFLALTSKIVQDLIHRFSFPFSSSHDGNKVLFARGHFF